jgi:hypothetical protein
MHLSLVGLAAQIDHRGARQCHTPTEERSVAIKSKYNCNKKSIKTNVWHNTDLRRFEQDNECVFTQTQGGGGCLGQKFGIRPTGDVRGVKIKQSEAEAEKTSI